MNTRTNYLLTRKEAMLEKISIYFDKNNKDDVRNAALLSTYLNDLCTALEECAIVEPSIVERSINAARNKVANGLVRIAQRVAGSD